MWCTTNINVMAGGPAARWPLLKRAPGADMAAGHKAYRADGLSLKK